MLKSVLRKLKYQYLDWKISTSPFYSRFPCRPSQFLIDSRGLISYEHRFVYFRIPKAANSTIVASLLGGGSLNIDRDSVESLKKGDLRLSTLSAYQTEEILTTFKLFTFVRNPYSRLYSCYLDKVVRKHQVATTVRRFLSKNAVDEVTFDEFLDYLDTGINLYADAHWARQSDLLPVPLSRLDFVGSVENITTDHAKLLDILRVKAGATQHFAPHSTGASSRLIEITPNQAARIANIYSADFEMFGYSKVFDPNNLLRRNKNVA